MRKMNGREISVVIVDHSFRKLLTLQASLPRLSLSLSLKSSHRTLLLRTVLIHVIRDLKRLGNVFFPLPSYMIHL
jgi:hypothetical protein